MSSSSPPMADRCGSISAAQMPRMNRCRRVTALLAHEREIGFEDIGTYARFAARVHHTKRQLLSFLIECKESGAKVCGYGAPGKGNTLLNYCGIGTDFLDFTVDRNPYKHGRYTPGMHIPIYPVSAIDEAQPDYLLILPWNLKHEIIAQMRHVGGLGLQVYRADPRCPSDGSRESCIMKVVLFCGGLGTRIREYSENIPKPMVPIGPPADSVAYYAILQPIWAPGLRSLPWIQGKRHQRLFSELQADDDQRLRGLGFRQEGRDFGRTAAGLARYAGRHRDLAQYRRTLVAVRHLVADEEIFLANYSDGLTDAPLPDMIERFKKSGKIGCFIAIHPPFSFHLAEFDEHGIRAPVSFEPGIRHLDQRRLFHFSQQDLRLYPRRRRAGP